MREILGRRRWFRWSRRERSALRSAALTCAERWQWPVVPGVGCDGQVTEGRPGDRRRPAPGTGCACPRPDCPVPGIHPYDPGLLAATTDPRMVGWWWTRRPDAPVLLATGSRVSAVSLPTAAGAQALAVFDALGFRIGPVLATPGRVVLLVAPYSFEELGELLERHDWVPHALRFHGNGGYVVLPPSRTAAGPVEWVREPRPGADGAAPWLPGVSGIIDTLVRAGVSAPDSASDGNRLAY